MGEITGYIIINGEQKEVSVYMHGNCGINIKSKQEFKFEHGKFYEFLINNQKIVAQYLPKENQSNDGFLNFCQGICKQ